MHLASVVEAQSIGAVQVTSQTSLAAAERVHSDSTRAHPIRCIVSSPARRSRICAGRGHVRPEAARLATGDVMGAGTAGARGTGKSTGPNASWQGS